MTGLWPDVQQRHLKLYRPAAPTAYSHTGEPLDITTQPSRSTQREIPYAMRLARSRDKRLLTVCGARCVCSEQVSHSAPNSRSVCLVVCDSSTCRLRSAAQQMQAHQNEAQKDRKSSGRAEEQHGRSRGRGGFALNCKVTQLHPPKYEPALLKIRSLEGHIVRAGRVVVEKPIGASCEYRVRGIARVRELVAERAADLCGDGTEVKIHILPAAE